MLACKGHFNGYLDFDCYNELIYQFLEKNLDTNENILNFYKRYKFPTTSLEKTRTNIFPKLMKYLSNSHVFYDYDNGQKCNYLSYLLYDDIIKQEFGECKSSTFDIFQKFVQELNTIGINNACASKLEHLDPYKFEKMRNLYKLYDLLRSVKKKEKWRQRPDLCSDLETLIYYYNRFDENYYKDDLNLRNLLEKLRHKIQENTWVSNDNCSAKLEYLWPPKIFPTEKVKPVEMKEEASHLTHSSQESTHVKSETEDGENRNAIESELPGREENLQQEVETLAEPEGELKEEDHGNHQGEITQQFPNSLHSFPPRKTYEENEMTLRSGFGTDTMHPLPEPNNSRGIVDKIQYALTDTFQNIEPAPILGVSGGMGALFLLFKYTPVGSFFGGRRRRIHQIPSSFRGFPPGDFSNFQEYDGGFIGYGPMNINPLAE